LLDSPFLYRVFFHQNSKALWCVQFEEVAGFRHACQIFFQTAWHYIRLDYLVKGQGLRGIYCQF
jgi:hypothetical protein